jgi:hypothetical protein
VAAAPVRHQLLVTEPVPEVPAGAPITRILDCAVYLRPACGGLMLGGFEAAPLPVDPRAEAPGFDTDDVPLDRVVLDAMAARVAGLARWITGGRPAVDLSSLARARFGSLAVPLPDNGLSGGSGPGSAVSSGARNPLSGDELIERGTWQYAHYYDPLT